ncbi:MAG: hypothetical protein L7F77_04995 [Candidatus Magnetominusculus sp. LBB02]|nr:hypothetical protein [Candidatus Magnetominusculus sp. LBB02]
MDIDKLRGQIKRNCDVSDAKFWGFYSICGMLLRIRQLYRQVHALTPWDAISNDHILPWIAEQEAKWEQLEDEQFGDIAIDGISYQPFDVEAINAVLIPNGLLYGAGFGMHNKPTFFLGRLLKMSTICGCQAYYTEEELERDLFAAPAMLQGRRIYIRLCPFRQMIYEKFTAQKGQGKDPLMDAVIADLGTAATDDFARRFDALTMDVSVILLLHEAAEYAGDGDGGGAWLEAVNASYGNRFVEIYLRAMKDLLADTSGEGPLRHIIDTQDRTLLAFYTILMEPARLEIFPEITAAYHEFTGSESWQTIERACASGYRRAGQFRQEILSIWENGGSVSEIESHIRGFLKEM